MKNATRIIPATLVVLAIASRVAAVWVLQSHHVPRSTYEHGEIAANLLAGKGFTTHFLGRLGQPRNRRRFIPRWSLWLTPARESKLLKPYCSSS